MVAGKHHSKSRRKISNFCSFSGKSLATDSNTCQSIYSSELKIGTWTAPKPRFQLRGAYLRSERKRSSLECWDKSNAFTSPRHVEDCTKLSLTKAEWTRHIPAYDVVDCYALLTQQARTLLVVENGKLGSALDYA